jgi:hypothetical protein
VGNYATLASCSLANEDGVVSLPADASRYDTKRLVADLVLLVEHQKVGWSSLSLESLFAMLDSPLELLSSNQDLAENGIDSGLATVEACCSNNCVLVVEQEPASSQYNVLVFSEMRYILQQAFQDLSPLSERGFRPCLLGFRSLCNNTVNAVRSDWIHKAK